MPTVQSKQPGLKSYKILSIMAKNSSNRPFKEEVGFFSFYVFTYFFYFKKNKDWKILVIKTKITMF